MITKQFADGSAARVSAASLCRPGLFSNLSRLSWLVQALWPATWPARVFRKKYLGVLKDSRMTVRDHYRDDDKHRKHGCWESSTRTFANFLMSIPFPLP